jgi:crotonyl-CoA carboxylase/reductase
MAVNVDEKKLEVFPLGAEVSLDTLPDKMYAWTVREERFGEPQFAFQKEIVPLPQIGPADMLIYNMVAGFNYNGVWAGLGKPKNVIADHSKYDKENDVDFHICGSESSAIVVRVGSKVKKFKIGDEIIAGGTQYDPSCPIVKSGLDPILSPTSRIWGYEANWGSFAQFSKVQEHQCVLKPKSLDWYEAATIGATGVTTYKMIAGWKGNEIKKGDVVLIWGGSGGLGTIAIQLVRYFEAIPIAVVSSQERAELCMKLGAAGCINRNDYTHWGRLDDSYANPVAQRAWLKEALRFRREIWKIAGMKKNPNIVFEHVGEDTLPTSLFVCGKGGMVVLCGGTTGYTGSFDLRYLWLSQKRIQGSHAGTDYEFEKMIEASKVKPYISKIYEFDDIAKVHQLMYANSEMMGKLAVRIGLTED